MNNFKIPIIYEDNDILVINKPAGLVVHPAPEQGTVQGKLTLIDWLVKNRPEIIGIGEDSERPGIVHRLDKDTSGVLLIAKNQKTFEYLKDQFKNRKIKKTYLALVHGKLNPPAGGRSGVIDLSIGKSKSDFRKKTTQKIVGKIREAVTEYRVIKHLMLKNKKHQMLDNYTLVEVYPKTGRMHQIRVHFKAIGHPIVCDKLYGFKKQECPLGLTRHFLHAQSLELELPVDGKIKLEADLPDDLQATLTKLEKGI